MRDCSRIWNWKFDNNKTQFILITQYIHNNKNSTQTEYKNRA